MCDMRRMHRRWVPWHLIQCDGVRGQVFRTLGGFGARITGQKVELPSKERKHGGSGRF